LVLLLLSIHLKGVVEQVFREMVPIPRPLMPKGILAAATTGVIALGGYLELLCSHLPDHPILLEYVIAGVVLPDKDDFNELICTGIRYGLDRRPGDMIKVVVPERGCTLFQDTHQVAYGTVVSNHG
jgi:hypothetical protein